MGLRIATTVLAAVAMFAFAPAIAVAAHVEMQPQPQLPASAHAPAGFQQAGEVPASGFVASVRAQETDDEPDVLLMALLTVAVAGGAAVLALIGYAIRNRTGFWLHRPPPREEGAEPEEHR